MLQYYKSSVSQANVTIDCARQLICCNFPPTISLYPFVNTVQVFLCLLHACCANVEGLTVQVDSTITSRSMSFICKRFAVLLCESPAIRVILVILEQSVWAGVSIQIVVEMTWLYVGLCPRDSRTFLAVGDYLSFQIICIDGMHHVVGIECHVGGSAIVPLIIVNCRVFFTIYLIKCHHFDISNILVLHIYPQVCQWLSFSELSFWTLVCLTGLSGTSQQIGYLPLKMWLVLGAVGSIIREHTATEFEYSFCVPRCPFTTQTVDA